jgi:asparagine synthase (glutamine-hydrolysing)
MCGVAGILGLDQARTAPRIAAMLDAQLHRGPDDRGEWLGEGIGLGHVRLSILDVSPAGHQPMLLDDRLAVVFNGEVFNYVELRRELEGLGHSFVTGTDTEIVLHAYDQWGAGCCRRFNGMWAFAIWDVVRRELFCSRDRFGVKPFFYAIQGGEFLFSSEIKSLLAASPVLRRPDHAYLARFLRTSLCSDGEQTFFSEVRALLPGHSVTVRLSGGRAAMDRPVRYWAFDPQRSAATYDYRSPEQTLRGLLEDSVRLRLRADVPVGTCLSGGLDSSSIVALAAGQLGGAPVRTFSAIYPHAGYDESRYVRIVNAAFPTVPHEVSPEPGHLLEVMPRIAWHQDEPSAGPGLYSQWHVMQSAAGAVKVLLDGQGADELLGGYTPYFVDALRSLVRRAVVRPTGANLAALRGGWTAARGAHGDDVLRMLVLGYVSEPVKRAVRPVLGRRGGTEVRPEYLAEWEPRRDAWAVDGPFHDRLANVLYDALFVKSLPALLRYEDRSSMAFSLEARTPFLDYRLVEFALALPFDARISGPWTKAVLRRAMQGTLPDAITWRRDKLGYPTPLAEWLRGEFRADAEAVIFSPEFRRRGIFDDEGVRRLWAQHVRGEQDNSWNVWRWLSVEFWFREFIDGPASRVREAG